MSQAMFGGAAFEAESTEMSDDNILGGIKAEDRVGDVIARLRAKLFTDFSPINNELKDARASLREAISMAESSSERAQAALKLKL